MDEIVYTIAQFDELLKEELQGLSEKDLNDILTGNLNDLSNEEKETLFNEISLRESRFMHNQFSVVS